MMFIWTGTSKMVVGLLAARSRSWGGEGPEGAGVEGEGVGVKGRDGRGGVKGRDLRALGVMQPGGGQLVISHTDTVATYLSCGD